MITLISIRLLLQICLSLAIIDPLISRRVLQELELLSIGFFAGIMSGFFGVGGGTITVPLLVAIGFDIRHAIGISAFQMIFSSVYGSYLNHKKALFDIRSSLPFLVGGALGGGLGGLLMSKSSPFWLAVLMLSFILLTTLKLFVSNPTPSGTKKGSALLYAVIGFGVGTLGGMVGIGGALILTPVLIGFLGFSLVEAVAVSLFFVVSSSVFAFLSIYMGGFVELDKALLVALPSLAGVAIGIYIAGKTAPQKLKNLLILLYLLIIFILTKKLIIGN